MKTEALITAAILSVYGSALPLNSSITDINRSFTEKHVRRAKNHHIATFDYIGKEFSVTFDFVPTKLIPSWASVFHLSNANSDTHGPGGRIPAVWFRRENEVSYIYVGTDLSGTEHVYAQPEPAIAVGKKITVNVQQMKFGGNYVYTISINGKVIWGIYNKTPREFAEVKMYCGNPWYDVQEGEMTNLEVLSS